MRGQHKLLARVPAEHSSGSGIQERSAHSHCTWHCSPVRWAHCAAEPVPGHARSAACHLLPHASMSCSVCALVIQVWWTIRDCARERRLGDLVPALHSPCHPCQHAVRTAEVHACILWSHYP